MVKEKSTAFSSFLVWFSRALKIKQTNYSKLDITLLFLVLLSLFKKRNKPLLIVCDNDLTAKELYKFCYLSFPGSVFYFPKTESKELGVSGFIPEYLRYQTEAYNSFLLKKPFLFISTSISINEIKYSTKNKNTQPLSIYKKQKININTLLNKLNSWEYKKRDKAEFPGSYSCRGCIFDIFPTTSANPFRLEFFGHEIYSLRTFDPKSQRTIKKITSATVWPPVGTTSALDTISNLSKNFIKTLFIKTDGCFHSIVNNKSREKNQTIKFLNIKKSTLPKTRIEKLKHKNIFIFCDSKKHKERLLKKENKNTVFVSGSIPQGLLLKNQHVFLLSSSETLGSNHHTPGRWDTDPTTDTRGLLSWGTISVGDCVVHKTFGIGIYMGLKTVTAGKNKQECLEIKYTGNDKIYVPTERLSLVFKYHNQEKRSASLSVLGSSKWKKQKQKAIQSSASTVRDLIKTHTARSNPRGFVYNKNDELYEQLVDSFPYKETSDQEKAINSTVSDMEKKLPMDRLICGGVGFGKTEVALRAIIKAVSTNKTVFFLSPTTILADQHFILAKERLGPIGVQIELFSRFKSKSDQKRILQEISCGALDLVIGTHRLLSPDVFAPSLGLLIIDEEHRFGVRHKEIIKNMRTNIDVLTLTATPIPRTLHQALVGIKDISNIFTPPLFRKPIKTRVNYFNWDIITLSIKFELLRGGQVYFLHNNINSLPFYFEKLSKLFPSHSIKCVHGKMKNKELELSVLSFFRGEIDILICTSIIESGLDVSNANTIIINNSQNFGLSQLYQIRGRVGRGPREAHCMLLIPTKAAINQAAVKRLKALELFTSLGSSYDLALSDLEIRGAGNIFGHEQSGHISQLGYDVYCDILKETMNKIQGKKTGTSSSINYSGEHLIPPLYIHNSNDRLYFYQKLARSSLKEEILDISKELTDIYGPQPKQVQALISIASLRISLQKTPIDAVQMSPTFCRFSYPLSAQKQIKKKIKEKNFSSHKNSRKKLVSFEIPVSSLKASLSVANKYANLFNM